MLAKKIKYTNYNGEERERTFYFNLSKAEILDMEMSKNGGYENFINRIIETRDVQELIKMFKDLIKSSYGIKSDDGEMFIKNEQVFNEFAQTDAYSELYIELATDAEAAVNFVTGIFPQKVMKELENSPEYKKKMEEYKEKAKTAVPEQSKPTPVQ